MKAYKGFDKNLKCRGFQYEVGKEYEENEAKLCDKGFHACEFPFDVFKYYEPATSRYCEVEIGDVSGEREDDSKICGKKIKIEGEIGLAGIIKAGVQMIIEKSERMEKRTGDRSAATNTGYRSAATNTGDKSVATNTGYRSVATNTGNWSAATNTGNQSAATNTGDWSAATNTGNWSAATNTGDWSAATVAGKQSVAISLGIDGKAKGALGCWIVLAEWKETDTGWERVDVQSKLVDGDEIKEDTFYMLIDGKFAEVE